MANLVTTNLWPKGLKFIMQMNKAIGNSNLLPGNIFVVTDSIRKWLLLSVFFDIPPQANTQMGQFLYGTNNLISSDRMSKHKPK